MKVITSDSREFLKTFNEYEFDIIFADPPYALGSEVIVRKDGKVDYAKASDFMDKWDMPTGDYWEQWFIEAFRTLKHGGVLLMYGMDRQTLLFKYYASLSGFEEHQSLYWYYISNFPKATDLSKMIDKNAGLKGEPIGKLSGAQGYDSQQKKNKELGFREYKEGLPFERADKNIYAPCHELAKKYDGYKYSIAPLKQTCETIMVFRKPTKTGSVLHDTLAMENGDTTITCGALDIDGNRVKVVGEDTRVVGNRTKTFGGDEAISGGEGSPEYIPNEKGRYPAQTFIDSGTAEVLDRQSGVGGGGFPKHNNEIIRQGMREDAPAFNSGNSGIDVNKGQGMANYGDVGGASKILHKVDHDIFIYEPKVNQEERNDGLDVFETKQYSHDGREKPIENPYQRNDSVAQNNHPTVKPVDLNAKILKLFKTPNEQKICYPFAGSGSEIIGGLQADFQNWVACEINQEYVDIADARIKHYKENKYVQLDLFEIGENND